MSHAKILCISDSREGCITVNDCDDLAVIGADYIGENKPELVTQFLDNNFGSDIFKFTPLTDKDNDELIGRIRFNRKTIDFATRCITEWQQRVAAITPDEIIQRGHIPYELTEDIKVSMADDLINFNYCYYTIMEWAIEVSKYYINKPLYIVGCVDYHY